MNTIDYYNNYSQDFYDRTINADLSDSYNKFLKHIPKWGGFFFACYKYGNDHMHTKERDFWNMDENTILEYLVKFQIVDIWKVTDIRSRVTYSKHKAWLHFIVRK